MIQPISSNVNFTGRVSLGRNLPDKVQIAQNISALPIYMQTEAINALNNLKTGLELNTPDSFIGCLDVRFTNGINNEPKNASFDVIFSAYKPYGSTDIIKVEGGNLIDETGKSAIPTRCGCLLDDVVSLYGETVNRYSGKIDENTQKVLNHLA